MIDKAKYLWLLRVLRHVETMYRLACRDVERLTVENEVLRARLAAARAATQQAAPTLYLEGGDV